MTAIERTAYPRFKHSFTEDELAQFYTPTEADLAFVENLADDEAQGLTMMLLLKQRGTSGHDKDRSLSRLFAVDNFWRGWDSQIP